MRSEMIVYRATAYGGKCEITSLIHHQDVTCCVAYDRFSLRRITYTPQSALLGAPAQSPGSSTCI